MHSELSYGLSIAPKLQRVGSIHFPGWDQPTPDRYFSQAMLLSEGIHNCLDPLELEQLRSRQPRRTTSMPTAPPTSDEVITTQISLRGIYRNLRRRRGPT